MESTSGIGQHSVNLLIGVNKNRLEKNESTLLKLNTQKKSLVDQLTRIENLVRNLQRDLSFFKQDFYKSLDNKKFKGDFVTHFHNKIEDFNNKIAKENKNKEKVLKEIKVLDKEIEKIQLEVKKHTVKIEKYDYCLDYFQELQQEQ